MAQISNRERLESELSIARSIQLGLLPQPLPDAATRGSQLRAVMYPAREVGGDFYDYFVLADGRLCFAIGDVSGKGVPAALFMAIVRTLIRSVAEEEHDPGAIATKVNHRLAENNPKLMFVTLLIGVFTRKQAPWPGSTPATRRRCSSTNVARSACFKEAAARPAACWTTRRIPP